MSYVDEWKCLVGTRTEQRIRKKAIDAIPLCHIPYFPLRAITKVWWQSKSVLQHALTMIHFTAFQSRPRKKPTTPHPSHTSRTPTCRSEMAGKGAPLSISDNMPLGITNGKRWKSSNCWMTFCNKCARICITNLLGQISYVCCNGRTPM